MSVFTHAAMFTSTGIYMFYIVTVQQLASLTLWMTRFNSIYLCLWSAWHIVTTGLCCRAAPRPWGNIFLVGCGRGGLISWWKKGMSVRECKCHMQWMATGLIESKTRIRTWQRVDSLTDMALVNLSCAVYKRQLVDVFAAPPKLWKTKQCEVMSLLLLMQTSCVVLWAAWDLNSVCVRAQMYSVCARVFLRFKTPLPRT